MWREIKYSLGLIIPLIVFLSLNYNGFWSYFALVFAFGFIPLVELVLKGSEENLTKEQEKSAKKQFYYDLMLYVHVPLQYALLLFFLWKVSTGLATADLIGKIISMGIACGVLGINVAHELGHRHKTYEQKFSIALLLTSFYPHFFIEHNRGHHKNIATPLDPASSRYGENIYAFYIRTVRDSYLSAWHLENRRLRKKNIPILSIQNQMLRFHIVQLLMLALSGFIFGIPAMLAFVSAGVFGFLLLETVNYIEHYGLQREEVEPGRYEKVKPHHSWNSNHPLGRILLYELTRHSDHHFHSGRKYQVLRHFDDAPQMPTGYPGMMLTALIPPLWFKIMHKRIENHQKSFVKMAA